MSLNVIELKVISILLHLFTACLCASIHQDGTSWTSGDNLRNTLADDNDILALSFELQSKYGHLIKVNTTEGKLVNVFASHQVEETDEVLPVVYTSIMTRENETLVPADLSDMAGDNPQMESPNSKVCDVTDINATDISGKSLCAWQQIVDINENRIPSKIMSAKCKCDGKCISIDNPATCKKVAYTIPVFWFNSTSKLYSRGETHVATACVCAF